MSSAYVRQEDVELYTQLLRELKARMDAAARALSIVPRNRFNADLAAAEIRIALELLLLGGLITNRAEVEKVTTALHKQDPTAAKKLVERVNSGYWPRATRQVQVGPDRFKLEPVTGSLTAEDWGRAYGFLSDQLHASNPYKSEPYSAEPLDPLYERMQEIHTQVVNLTNHHWIELANRDYALAASMQTHDTGDVQVAVFEVLRDEHGQPMTEADLP